jgi:hypothetical protein
MVEISGAKFVGNVDVIVVWSNPWSRVNFVEITVPSVADVNEPNVLVANRRHTVILDNAAQRANTEPGRE